MFAKFMLSDNGTLSINSQIHIKVTHAIRKGKKKKAIHLTGTKSGNVGTRARGEQGEKRQRKDMEFSFT